MTAIERVVLGFIVIVLVLYMAYCIDVKSNCKGKVVPTVMGELVCVQEVTP